MRRQKKLPLGAERALRSQGSETVTNWYCNACSWSVTVIDGKPEQLTIHQVRSEFANHVYSDVYGKHNAEIKP
jgi:hypothetical protein